MTKKEIEKQIKQKILAEMQNKPKSIHQVIVEITKAASAGLSSLESLKKREMPTEKAKAAFNNMVKSLDTLFKDMLQRPMNYLDKEPNKIVDDRLDNINSKEQAIVDHVDKK